MPMCKAPCKGKSFTYRKEFSFFIRCFLKLLPLLGARLTPTNPGRCPGLRVSAPSGRAATMNFCPFMACWFYELGPSWRAAWASARAWPRAILEMFNFMSTEAFILTPLTPLTPLTSLTSQKLQNLPFVISEKQRFCSWGCRSWSCHYPLASQSWRQLIVPCCQWRDCRLSLAW